MGGGGEELPGQKSGQNDRIIILEDIDRDGRHDERIVFYDKLEYVSGIEVGFGGAWVMSIPNFYFIPDEDYDGVPDGEPKVLLDGFGTHANAHNIANGFAWGPDGWLYGTHGVTNWSLPGKPGTPKEERRRLEAACGGISSRASQMGVVRGGHDEPVGHRLERFRPRLHLATASTRTCSTSFRARFLRRGRNRPTSRYAI